MSGPNRSDGPPKHKSLRFDVVVLTKTQKGDENEPIELHRRTTDPTTNGPLARHQIGILSSKPSALRNTAALWSFRQCHLAVMCGISFRSCCDAFLVSSRRDINTANIRKTRLLAQNLPAIRNDQAETGAKTTTLIWLQCGVDQCTLGLAWSCGTDSDLHAAT